MADTSGAGHRPVMAQAAVDLLAVRADGMYVDCTAGAGGHAEAIARRLTTGRLLALDRDPAAVALAAARLRDFPSVTVQHRNYADLADVLAEQGICQVDGVLIDAGLSSMQIDDAKRGFSFQADSPLDMRMDTAQQRDAAALLAELGEQELRRILKEYGDIRQAGRIAAAIVRRCERGAMKTTGDLVEAVREALPFVQGVPEEVRTVFQAVRIAVNDELNWLRKGMHEALDVLAEGGRLVVISFHSGEDRIVKNVLRDASRPVRHLHPDGRVREVEPPRVRVLTRKPLRPGEEEVRRNPRAQSARLRAAEVLREARRSA